MIDKVYVPSLKKSFWEMELNSPVFLAGIEKIIDITETTRKESGFFATHYEGAIHYPFAIQIGDKRSVQLREYLYDANKIKQFHKATKKHAPTTQEFSKLSPEKRLKHKHEYLEWLTHMNGNTKTAFQVDYPRPLTEEERGQKEAYRDAQHTGRIMLDSQVRDTLLSVHAHPPSHPIVYPSPQDLDTLHDDRVDNELACAQNPLSVIVGTQPRGSHTLHYPLLMIQEKEDFRTGKSTWKKLSKAFYRLTHVPAKKFGQEFIRAREIEPVLKRYTIMTAEYWHPSSIITKVNGGWDEFSVPQS